MSSLVRAKLVAPLAAMLVTMTACSPGEPPGSAPAAALPPFDPTAVRGPVSPLPEPDVGADGAKIQLGKALFNDGRVSADGRTACATCHDVAAGGDDGRRYSIGVAGEPLPVNTPTVLNSDLNFAQFWDGRARTLEEQITMTLSSSSEMGSSPEHAAAALASDPELAARFERVYGKRPTGANVVDAIAAYVRALRTPGAPFDRYLKGDVSAISAEARAGYELFIDSGCVSCHQGRGLGGNLFQRFGVMGDYFADRGDITEADLGRYNVTGRERDRFKFKVPSLRNVADTAPYFHDGSAATLDNAVRTMLEYQLGRAPSEAKVTAIVAFLETLSGEVEESLQ